MNLNMNAAKLEKLGLSIELDDQSYYHSEGIVKSLLGRLKEMDDDYRGRSLQPSICVGVIEEACRGFCVSIQCFDDYTQSPVRRGDVHYHTIVMDDNNPQNITFWQGHEETEMLLKADQLVKLEKLLEDNGVNVQDLRSLHKEVICDIGGIYALLKEYENQPCCITPTPYILEAKEWLLRNIVKETLFTRRIQNPLPVSPITDFN